MLHAVLNEYFNDTEVNIYEFAVTFNSVEAGMNL